MTRAQQLRIANEIDVLCGIARGYFNSFVPPGDHSRRAQEKLDQMSTKFIELTDELVDDGAPSELGICPQCGEEIAAAEAQS